MGQIRNWPSGKLPLTKIVSFSTKLPFAILLKKMSSFWQFFTFKWQFSGGPGANLTHFCSKSDMGEQDLCNKDTSQISLNLLVQHLTSSFR